MVPLPFPLVLPPRTSILNLLTAVSMPLIGGAVAPLHGEEFIPLAEALEEGRFIDGRIEQALVELEKPDLVVSPSLARDEREKVEKLSGWDLGVAMSMAYDSNIFLSAIHEQSDLVIRVSPRISYVLGRSEEEGAFVRFEYRPTGVIYVDHGADSRIDQRVVLEAGWRGSTAAVRYGGEYRRLGDATADTGGQVDRNEYANELRAAWYPREKVTVELAAGQESTNYDRSDLNDSDEIYGEVVLRYAYSPKTEVSLGYRVGRYEVDRAGDQTFQQATVGMMWRPRKKISVAMELGVEHRDFDRGSDNYPVIDLRLGWEPCEGLDLFLGGYRREQTSAFFPGQNYSLTGVVAGFRQRINQRWSAAIEGGYEQASYSRVSGLGPSGRKDKILFVRPSIDYTFNERARLSVYYQFSQDQSNRPGFGYDSHQLGVDLGYDF